MVAGCRLQGFVSEFVYGTLIYGAECIRLSMLSTLFCVNPYLPSAGNTVLDRLLLVYHTSVCASCPDSQINAGSLNLGLAAKVFTAFKS